MNISRQVAVFRIVRYRVERAMPKRAAISSTGISAVLSRARMVLISLAESFAGRPPLTTASAGRLKASDGSLPNQIAFKPGQRRKDVEYETASR
jgi:predicted short-subunit dehydrogenase-like oxidoreductase (DUF2520 family)